MIRANDQAVIAANRTKTYEELVHTMDGEASF